jgi:hypothetical protein
VLNTALQQVKNIKTNALSGNQTKEFNVRWSFLLFSLFKIVCLIQTLFTMFFNQLMPTTTQLVRFTLCCVRSGNLLITFRDKGLSQHKNQPLDGGAVEIQHYVSTLNKLILYIVQDGNEKSRFSLVGIIAR